MKKTIVTITLLLMLSTSAFGGISIKPIGVDNTKTETISDIKVEFLGCKYYKEAIFVSDIACSVQITNLGPTREFSGDLKNIVAVDNFGNKLIGSFWWKLGRAFEKIKSGERVIGFFNFRGEVPTATTLNAALSLRANNQKVWEMKISNTEVKNK